MKPTLQKNTLLKNAQANAESIFFKRVFFSATQRKNFANASFLIKLFSPPHGHTAITTSCASNVNRFEQSVRGLQTTHLRTDRRASANKGFAIAGVPCFADTFVQGGSSVLRMKFSAKTPRHRKPPKRQTVQKLLIIF